ncbi:MAG: cysteine--tRNA ligase [Euryarchaeota archaeon RBG_16_68_12]|nr:MAG: cysteine--tRNA ligase [Euryarchaeota archaeon RBG_16_68_12]
MALWIYNTLTRRKEEFRPLHGNRVSMFVCGITPHDVTHVGHAKTYVAFDVVARYLRQRGYSVFYLQNVTDIEDRVIEKMQTTGRAWKDLTAEYWRDFQDAMAALRCDSVNLYAKATDYIPEILAQIQGLLDKGFAYVAEDGSVYYDTTRYPDWGKLSGQRVEEHRPGARVAVDERKRDPADFALWKAQKPGEPAWDSPWGKGRPGWHIEDTAITIAHFGPQYDLHGGAVELAFPHHEAEIAQAEAFTGVRPFVKVWMHGGMLMVSGEEMHKSLGNFWSVADALKAVAPEELRFYLLNAQYRSPIDFTREALEEAKAAYRRIRDGVGNLRAAERAAAEKGPGDEGLLRATLAAMERFREVMDDDFNTREAVAVLYDLVGAANKAIKAGVGRAAAWEALRALDGFDEVLAILPRSAAGSERVLAGLLDFIVQLREDARKKKDFATSDAIRTRLGELGVGLEDTKDGVRWKLT